MDKLHIALTFIFLNFSQITLSATVIHVGLLIDGESSIPSPEMSIIIEGSKIEAIEAGFITPDADDEYIDLSRKRVLDEDRQRCIEKYKRYKKIYSILKHIADTNNIELESLLNATIWHLDRYFKSLRDGDNKDEELSDEDNVDIAAAKIAATTSPTTPLGKWVTIKYGKIRSVCTSPLTVKAVTSCGA